MDLLAIWPVWFVLVAWVVMVVVGDPIGSDL
jgi:hypothetical protein